MKCKNCNQSDYIKKGKRNNIQRYYCKKCKQCFQEHYLYKALNLGINDLIKCLLKEGCGIRSISRIIGISTKTVLSRMLKIAEIIQPPYFQKLDCNFEVDELWSFVRNKNNPTWITYVIEQQTKTVIDFSVGSRSKENLKPLINKILQFRPKRIYTDKLKAYTSLIPNLIHKQFQYCTNKIERMNLTLRTHIKRLTRKTICFSKNKNHLEAHLKIYFWG